MKPAGSQLSVLIENFHLSRIPIEKYSSEKKLSAQQILSLYEKKSVRCRERKYLAVSKRKSEKN